MMLAAVTLIPAVLTIFGRRSFWPMRPRKEAGEIGQADWQNRIYGRVGAIVLRRPGLTLAITVLALSALVAGLIPFRTNYDQLASLPGIPSPSGASNCCAAAFWRACCRRCGSTSPRLPVQGCWTRTPWNGWTPSLWI